MAPELVFILRRWFASRHVKCGVEQCCFRVILPAVQRGNEAVAAAPQAASIATGSARVLLVEDEEGVRDGLAVLLQMIGYEVTAVGSGEEALQLPEQLLSCILPIQIPELWKPNQPAFPSLFLYPGFRE